MYTWNWLGPQLTVSSPKSISDCGIHTLEVKIGQKIVKLPMQVFFAIYGDTLADFSIQALISITLAHKVRR